MNQLSIASYNVHSCRGVDRRTDPERIARIIRGFNADIVALQEVKSRLGQSNDIRQLSELAAATGMEGIPGPALLRSDSPCGTALLTRRDIVAIRHIELSIPGREPRGALDVDLEMGDGLIARIISTHLGLSAKERQVQVDQLLRALLERDSDLAVLTGDINEWFPFSRRLRQLNAYFGTSQAPRTFPSLLPSFALDRLWAGPSTAGVSAEVKVIKTLAARIASDHLPLVAEITVAAS